MSLTCGAEVEVESPKVALIMATVNRSIEIQRFCSALVSQSYPTERVVLLIVDQNSDDRLLSIVETFKDRLDIRYLRSTQRGLSHARNLGIRSVPNDVGIIGFPDDDCLYQSDTLTRVVDHLGRTTGFDVVTGRCTDNEGKDSISFFGSRPSRVNWETLWTSHVSVSIFMRKQVVDEVGGFDERLGAGTRFGSSEETDLMIRVLLREFRVGYFPDIVINHPPVRRVYDSRDWQRAYRYGLGQGALCRKHLSVSAVVKYGLMSLFRSLLGATLSVYSYRLFMFRWLAAYGKIEGFLCFSSHRVGAKDSE